MPRMSKARKQEWSFFLNDRGRFAYNTLCRKCTHNCKQSFRAIVIICPHYCFKRGERSHPSLADQTENRHSKTARSVPERK